VLVLLYLVLLPAESISGALACDFEWNADVTEPADTVRGDVARIWLYFSTKHGLKLEDGELDMYLRWSLTDTPTTQEFARNDRIRAKQGNGNPFVEMFPRP